MAIVRELVTILGTEFKEKGLKDYERGMDRLKRVAIGTAQVIGAAFTVEKIVDFVDELLRTGKEIDKIKVQLQNLARPGDDINAAMEQTFQIAQSIGEEYTKVADTYRDFLQSSQDANVSQEELLATTENIFKALKVDRATEEQQQTLFAILNRIDVMGKASPRMIGMLANTSHQATLLLESYFNTNVEGLQALAKQGKLTFDEMVKALGTMTPELEKKFGEVPWTVARGWTYARNAMVSAALEFLRVTKFSHGLGLTIKWLTDVITAMFKSFFNAIGGLKNAIEVLGIAMAIVLGPRMLAYLIEMVGWMWKFTAANWAAVAPWLAMAAGVAAVAIAIQDLVYWIQGKPSLIGTWVGSFKDLKSNFANLDIFAGFRFFDDLMKGDWSKAFDDLKLALTDTKAIVLEVATAVGAVTTAFGLWKVLEFSGLISAIRGVTNIIRGVKTEAGLAKTAVENVGKAKVAGKVAGQGELPLSGGGTGKALLGAGAIAGRLLSGAAAYALLGWSALEQAQTPEGQANIQAFIDKQKGPTLSPFGQRTWAGVKDWWSRATAWPTSKEQYGPPELYGPPYVKQPSPAYGGAFVDPKTGLFGTPGGGGLGRRQPLIEAPTAPVTPVTVSPTRMQTYDLAPPSVPPGALGKPVQTTNNDNKQITFNQSNSVSVQVQDDAGLASRIATSIGNYAGEMFSGIARDLGRSSPRTEAATQ